MNETTASDRELPEEVVEAVAGPIEGEFEDLWTQAFPDPNVPDRFLALRTISEVAAEEALRAGIESGRLLLVPEGSVGVALERVQAEQAVRAMDVVARQEGSVVHRALISARAFLDSALQQRGSQ